MKESLESARNVYHTLIIVSAIMFVFSFNMKIIPNPYRHAKGEIDRLESIIAENVKHGNLRFLYEKGGMVMSKADVIEMQKLEARGKKSIDSLNKIIDSLDKRKLKRASMKAKEILPVDLEAFWVEEGWVKTYHPDSMTLLNLSAFSRDLDSKRMFQLVLREHPEFYEFLIDNDYKTVTEFKSLLREKAEKFDESRKGNIDLLGLNVAIDDMQLIAPAVTAALQLYLIAIMLHIISTTRLIQDADTILSFPWLALFRSWFSKFIYAFSLGLPMFGAIEILSKSFVVGNNEAYWRYSYMVFFGALCFALCLIPSHVVKKAEEIDHKFKAKPSAQSRNSAQ